ncbi:PilN domain-containing protein [Geomobilimonas luticola]|uniref:PilN domain-containing protein n=1 Tax=Geomobilimonas luticola TaxID=1114878 RepID=A0ABS5SE91_9BACT|nr:PilN domain-containing protein [Geomobilimonas luticola]MBT0652829.1 PilN domain-containing protein [Geomobilimonas luticola]
MTRINLLPVRAAKKKETAKQQITILIAAVVAVLVAGLAFYSVTLAKVSGTKAEIKRSEAELQQLKTKIGEIDNIKKLQAEVKKKLDVLNMLRKEKSGPGVRLAKLSDITPDKMWLTNYAENAAKVTISGLAYSEDIIATFLRNLQESELFTDVELLVSEQKEESGVKLKKFDVTCNIKALKKEEPPPAQQKQQKK